MRSGVVIFPGSNCDRDMIVALRKITGKNPIKIWHKENDIPNLDLIVIPGGFSFGDYLSSGALAARSPVISSIKNHISRGGTVLGVCNGFQILIEAKILPGSLIRNKKLLFTCRETTLEVQNCIKNPFLSGFKKGECLKIPFAFKLNIVGTSNKAFVTPEFAHCKYPRESAWEEFRPPSGKRSELIFLLTVAIIN